MSQIQGQALDRFTCYFRKGRAECFAQERDGKPSCYGYAATYDTYSEDLGGFLTTIAPGCFDKVLSAGVDCRFLVNHDANLLFGRTKSGTLRLKSDDKGLYFDADPPRSMLWEHYAQEIIRGDMDGCSFAVDVEIDKWDFSGEIPIRTLMSVSNLYDVGPVAFPAFARTSAAASYALQQARAACVAKMLRPQLGLMGLGLQIAGA